MTIVVDASVVVAALVDDGPEGEWAESILRSGPLAAPHHMHVEVANILRRATLAGIISDDVASLAHADLLELKVSRVRYDIVADRVWELRGNLTSYDAWYVAVAEALVCPLATLDQRLVRSPGPECEFSTPR